MIPLPDQSLIVGSHRIKQKSNRIPLQPRNFQTNPIQEVKNKKKVDWIEISLQNGNSNKENHQPIEIESIDSSLAEELSVIRKRVERLRIEREKTEMMLRERDLVLEMEMREMEERGKEQKKVEIEVEKVQRLMELRSSLMRATGIKSLREIEEEKKIKEAQLQEEMRSEEMETSEGIVVDRTTSEGIVVDQTVEKRA